MGIPPRSETADALCEAQVGYHPMLSPYPTPGVVLESMLDRVLAQWQERFPGLTYAPAAGGCRLLLPSALDHGHESHFPLALTAFLDYLDRGVWPEALRARLRMRYTLLARAHDLVRREGVAAPEPAHDPGQSAI